MSAPRNDNASGQAGEGANKNKLNPYDTSAANARAIILRALRAAPQTTVTLRHSFGIMAPAPRILELRARGHEIDTIRLDVCTPDGISHKNVAQYCLRREAEQGVTRG